jgi:hypothetical protein
VGYGSGDGLLEQLAIADRPGGAAMAPPLGRHHKRAPAQLMGGTGNGGIGAAGTAMEQQISGDSLMGPGKITAAAGCDHKGASRSWTWPR